MLFFTNGGIRVSERYKPGLHSPQQVSAPANIIHHVVLLPTTPTVMVDVNEKDFLVKAVIGNGAELTS